jgi:hypothetical protein
MVVVINRAGLRDSAHRVVQQALSGITDIKQLRSFAQTQHPPLAFARKLSFSDGSYDLLVTRPSDPYVISFTVEASGRVIRAMVWDRLPDPEEVLQARIETTSPTVRHADFDIIVSPPRPQAG